MILATTVTHDPLSTNVNFALVEVDRISLEWMLLQLEKAAEMAKACGSFYCLSYFDDNVEYFEDLGIDDLQDFTVVDLEGNNDGFATAVAMLHIVDDSVYWSAEFAKDAGAFETPLLTKARIIELLSTLPGDPHVA